MPLHIQHKKLRCPRCSQLARRSGRYTHLGYDVALLGHGNVECNMCHHRWRSKNIAAQQAHPPDGKNTRR